MSMIEQIDELRQLRQQQRALAQLTEQDYSHAYAEDSIRTILEETGIRGMFNELSTHLAVDGSIEEFFAYNKKTTHPSNAYKWENSLLVRLKIQNLVPHPYSELLETQSHAQIYKTLQKSHVFHILELPLHRELGYGEHITEKLLSLTIAQEHGSSLLAINTAIIPNPKVKRFEEWYDYTLIENPTGQNTDLIRQTLIEGFVNLVER